MKKASALAIKKVYTRHAVANKTLLPETSLNPILYSTISLVRIRQMMQMDRV